MNSTTSYPQVEPSPVVLQTQSHTLSARLVFLAVVAIVIGAAAMRLLTFERYLPYMEHHDESFLYILARDWRGVEEGDFIAERLSGYPPLYVWLHSGIEAVFERVANRPWYTPPDYIYVLRLVAIAAGVATTLLIISIGWQLAGPLGGLFAGLLWAFAPLVVDNNSLAIADPFNYLTSAAAVSMALRAWKRQSLGWLFGCLLAGVATVYIKYWTLYPLFLWAVVAGYLIWKQGRRVLPGLALQVLVGAALAGGLLLYVSRAGLSRLSPEMTNFTDDALSGVLDMGRNLNNLSYFPLAIGHALFWVVIAGGLLAWWYSRRQGWRVVDWRLVAVLSVSVLVAVLPTSSFIYISSTKYIRHALPMTIVLMGLWGAAAAQVFWTVTKLVQNRPALRPLPWVMGLGLAGVTLIPYGFGTAELVRGYELTPIQRVLWQWADVNVPLDGLILMEPVSKVEATWNRAWSGYDGSKTFQWWFEDAVAIIGTPPADYLERGITYFAMSDGDRLTIYDPKKLDIDSFTDQLTLIKTIPAAPDLLGETVSFYSLRPPQVAADFDFGDEIQLAGYDLSTTTSTPGESITFRPYWRTNQQPTTNYSMFLHLYPADEDRLLAQYDGAPTSPARPTLTWDDPGELYIGGDVTLALPADLPPGEYRLALGLYDFQTGARLANADGDTYFSTDITIE